MLQGVRYHASSARLSGETTDEGRGCVRLRVHRQPTANATIPIRCTILDQDAPERRRMPIPVPSTESKIKKRRHRNSYMSPCRVTSPPAALAIQIGTSMIHSDCAARGPCGGDGQVRDGSESESITTILTDREHCGRVTKIPRPQAALTQAEVMQV